MSISPWFPHPAANNYELCPTQSNSKIVCRTNQKQILYWWSHVQTWLHIPHEYDNGCIVKKSCGCISHHIWPQRCQEHLYDNYEIIYLMQCQIHIITSVALTIVINTEKVLKIFQNNKCFYIQRLFAHRYVHQYSKTLWCCKCNWHSPCSTFRLQWWSSILIKFCNNHKYVPTYVSIIITNHLDRPCFSLNVDWINVLFVCV